MKLKSLLSAMVVMLFSYSAYANVQLAVYNCPKNGGPSDNGCVKTSNPAYLDYNVNGTTYWMWYATPFYINVQNASTPVIIYKGDSTGAPTSNQCTVANFSSVGQGLNCHVVEVDTTHANVFVNY